MEDRNYKLYVHISPSNKRYYGITSLEKCEDRWGNNGYKYKEQYFYRAINKYDWNNFKHIVLFSNLTKEEACLLEQMYIALYNTMNPKYGYNMTSGGEHYIASEEARRKNSEAHKGVNLSAETRQKMSASGKGRVFSDEHKKRISESNKIAQNRPDVKQRKSERTKGEKNPMYGKHISEEHRQKLRDNNRWVNAKEEDYIKVSNTSKKIWQQKTQEQRDKQIRGMCTKESQEKALQTKLKKLPLVLCIETGQIFDNLQQAAHWAKCSKENIRSTCVGKQNMAKGYHWKYVAREQVI